MKTKISEPVLRTRIKMKNVQRLLFSYFPELCFRGTRIGTCIRFRNRTILSPARHDDGPSDISFEITCAQGAFNVRLLQ